MPPKRKYRTKKGDSYASLSQFGTPQDLMNLNPGVPTLSPGQDMWVPNNVFAPLVNNGGWTPPPTPNFASANFASANSFMSGGQVNTGAFNVGAPQIGAAFLNQPEFMSPGGSNSPQSVFMRGTNSFQSGSQLNTQPGLQSILPPSVPSLPAPAGDVTQGAAPFGVNASGQRLDANGNVFDPATAQRDIYGGQFVQEGETRWTRNARGRVVRQVATGGSWRDVNRRRRGGAVAAVPEVPAAQGNMVNSALSWRVG